MEEVGSSGAPTRSTRLLWTAVVIAVVAFVLGAVGFLRAGVPFPSAVYNTLQLFTLNFAAPNNSGSYPVVLEIARFLAPAVTLLAAGTIAAGLFRDEFDRATARYAFRGAGNHVIVCGLSDLGTTTVRLLCRDHHVVAIEHDRSCPAISTVRSLGVPVVVGDGRVEDVDPGFPTGDGGPLRFRRDPIAHASPLDQDRDSGVGLIQGLREALPDLSDRVPFHDLTLYISSNARWRPRRGTSGRRRRPRRRPRR